jgi:hypothetical protein
MRSSIATLALMIATAGTLGCPVSDARSVEGQTPMSIAARPKTLAWGFSETGKPSGFVAMRVESVAKEKRGLFGILNSPSVAGWLPDAHVISGKRIGADRSMISARVPGPELPAGLGAGARLVLALKDGDTVMCLLMPTDAVTDDALLSWAETQDCGRETNKNRSP